jgi:membrane protein YdbS with pleckstrin-like domain
VLDAARSALLRTLRVPAEPHPPAGSPESLRVFRAARAYFHYRLLRWGVKQAGALLGAVLFLTVFGSPAQVARLEDRAVAIVDDTEARDRVHAIAWWFRTMASFGEIFTILEIVALSALVVQLPFSLLLARLDWELRWYAATDRSLRLREGVLEVREMTLTYANVQNVSIRQGPLQRLLGIADLVVQTAGGGAADDDAKDETTKHGLHEGRLRGIDNAEAVRDLILGHLRRVRDAGLGDAEDAVLPAGEPPALAAAQAVLAETRALRAALPS